MAETHRRELPTAAMLKLAQLELGLNNSTIQEEHLALQQPTAKDLKTVQHYAQQCRREAVLVQKQLQAMKTEYQRGLQAIITIDHLLQQLPAGKTHRKDQLWLELQKSQALKKLKRYGMAEQVKLTLKEQALQQTIAAAEAMKF